MSNCDKCKMVMCDKPVPCNNPRIGRHEPDPFIKLLFGHVNRADLLNGLKLEINEFRSCFMPNKQKAAFDVLMEGADICGFAAALDILKPNEIPLLVYKVLRIKYHIRQACYLLDGKKIPGYRRPRKYRIMLDTHRFEEEMVASSLGDIDSINYLLSAVNTVLERVCCES